MKQDTDSLFKHHRIIQFMEYMVGGGVYFWTGLVVFAICYNGLGWHWLPAKILADVIGWTLNFMIQRYWAFYDKRLQGQDRRVVLKYVLVNGVDIFIDYAIVANFVRLGFTPYVGFFVSSLFTTVWDYLWYRFWVFKPNA